MKKFAKVADCAFIIVKTAFWRCPIGETRKDLMLQRFAGRRNVKPA